MLKRLLKKYYYIGYEYDVFRLHRDTISHTNWETLKNLSKIGGGICLTLLVGCAFSEIIALNFWIYLLLLGFCVVVWGLEKVYQKKNIRMDRAVIGAVFVLIFGFGIYLGCFRNVDTSATSIFVFLVALPLLFIIRPSSVMLTQIAVVAIFLILSYHKKADYYVKIDLANAISFLVVGVALYYHNVSIKIRDIESRTLLSYEKDTDAMTKLLNRGGFMKQIEAHIVKSQAPGAFLVLDLDNFKGVNDELGHIAGDTIICETADLIKEHFREDDICGRIGGDEFVVFVAKLRGEPLEQRLVALTKALDRRLVYDKGTHHVSVSIGVALFPENGNDFDELYRAADTAMYQAKRSGKASYVFYEKAKE